MPMLKGQQVMLRPYTAADREGVLSWVNDPEATRYLSHRFDMPYTEKNADEFLSYVMSGPEKQAAFVIADVRTGAYLGQIDLLGINRIDRKAELGIVIAAGQNRSRGLGGEAIRLLCGYGFRVLGLNRIELRVFADNERARRCYRRCGFREEGVMRQAIWSDGAFRDEVVMGLLKEDWDAMEENA